MTTIKITVYQSWLDINAAVFVLVHVLSDVEDIRIPWPLWCDYTIQYPVSSMQASSGRAWLLETFPVNSRKTMHGMSLPHTGYKTLDRVATPLSGKIYRISVSLLLRERYLL